MKLINVFNRKFATAIKNSINKLVAFFFSQKFSCKCFPYKIHGGYPCNSILAAILGDIFYVATCNDILIIFAKHHANTLAKTKLFC